MRIFATDLETATLDSKYYKRKGKTKAYILTETPINLTFNETTRQGVGGEDKPTLLVTNPTTAKATKPCGHYKKPDVIKFGLAYTMAKKCNTLHYFHNGGKFDNEFIESILFDDVTFTQPKELTQYASQSEYLATNTKPFFRVTKSQNGKVITIYVPGTKKKIKKGKEVTIRGVFQHEIRDSLMLINQSIKQIAKDLKIEEKKDTMNCLSQGEETETYNSTMLDYAIHDTEILSQGIKENSKLGNTEKVPTTTSKLAFGRMKESLSLEPNKVSAKKMEDGLTQFELLSQDEEIRETNKTLQEKRIYRGGLTTVNPYKTFEIKRVAQDEVLLIEDVVSQYPHKMTYPMPVGTPIITQSKELINEVGNSDYIAFFKIRYKNLHQLHGTLLPPYIRKCDVQGEIPKHIKAEYVYGGKEVLIYKCKEEVQAMEKIMEGTDREIEEVVFWEKKAFIFNDFVETNIKRKSLGKETKNLTMEKGAKLELNSSYGNLGQKTYAKGKRTLSFGEEGDTDGVSEITEVMTEARNIGGASYITGLSRMYLIERAIILINHGGVVLGHDTDSNFVIIKKEEVDKLNHGRKLGDGDIDGMYYGYCIYAPKKYAMGKDSCSLETREENLKTGCAGVNKNTFNQNPLATYYDEGYNVLQRTVIIGGTVLKQKYKELLTEEYRNYGRNKNVQRIV